MSSPFHLQQGGHGALHVNRGDEEPVRHEVLFEDQYTVMRDQRLFVGAGLSPRRLLVGVGFVAVILAGLLFRAGWMQLVQGESFSARADQNRFRREILPARRGIIRDRHGVVLAENVPAFNVDMRWSDLSPQEISRVARAIGVTTGEITALLTDPHTPADEWVTVARDIPYEYAVALSIQLPDISGVSLAVAAKRAYPYSAEVSSLSHVLGYVGSISPESYAALRDVGYRRTDEIGKTGVEESYESQIRGESGERQSEVDAFGRPRAVVGDRAPIDGEDVTLTLDVGLQKATEQALYRGFERATGGIRVVWATSTLPVTRGAAVVMDAQTGGILSLVSLPAFDNNLFSGRVSSTAYQVLVNDPDRPLFPRAWAGQFPSGSTIKPLIATAALAEGVVTERTSVSSVGGIQVGPWFFPDWKAGGHGPTNVRFALAWSVNTFFYTVGGGYGEFIGLGVDRLTVWMHRFGLGARTGFDLSGEATGHVPSQQWKEETKGERWYIGDTYNLSIGQGDLLVTPLQMAQVTAAIANGGTLIEPHIASLPTEGSSLKIDPGILATVRQGMREAVTYGSARALSTLPFSAAGKTGTAQWRSDKPNHAWFIGYAPADKPEVVVVVLLEQGEEGSSYAVPVAGDILRAWWQVRSHSSSSAI